MKKLLNKAIKKVDNGRKKYPKTYSSEGVSYGNL